MSGEKFSNDGTEYDPAKRAEAQLSSIAAEEGAAEEVLVVDAELSAKEETRQLEKDVAEAKTVQVTEVTKERAAGPVIIYESDRNRSRVLFLSRDAAALQSGSVAAKRVSELSGMFAEVHVIVLTEGRAKALEIRRLGENVWVYETSSRAWWRTIFDARKIAGEQLVFGEGFRPDIIIAGDAFEAGLAGHLIAKRYNRPLQIHLSEDFFYDGFEKADPANSWRLMIANFVLKRAKCVRTPSAYIKSRVLEKYRKLRDRVDLLPLYYDLDAWVDTPISFDLREEYPQFKFILLHVSNMNELSHTEEVIDGLYYLLKQYPTMGLVIVGDGPRRGEYGKRILDYGLESRIVFGSPDTDLISCMKSAQVLVHTSEDQSQDDIVLKAAAVGLPIVCGDRGLASEFFIDGESILLCPLGNPACFGEKVNRLLNENPLRKQLSLNARDVVFDSIEQDYGTYLTAYRVSIEGCLVQETPKT